MMNKWWNLDLFPSECGVRHGENLSPLLFSLYLNDLENFIISGGVSSIDLEIIFNEIHVYLKLLILLYADDTIIFSNDKENFQKDFSFSFFFVFIALKGSHFWFLFDFTAAGVVPCGGR